MYYEAKNTWLNSSRQNSKYSEYTVLYADKLEENVCSLPRDAQCCRLRRTVQPLLIAIVALPPRIHTSDIIIYIAILQLLR